MSLLTLFNPVAPKTLIVKRTINQPFTLPRFNAGDEMTIAYQALLGNAGPFEAMSVGQYSLAVGIFKADMTTRLAYQNAFVADPLTNLYVGVLSLKDAAMTTFAATQTSPDVPLTAYFEVQITNLDGKPLRTYGPQPIQLYRGLITAGAATVQPEDVAATQSWVRNLFRSIDSDGTPEIVRSRSGAKAWLRYYDEDGQPQMEPLN